MTEKAALKSENNTGSILIVSFSVMLIVALLVSSMAFQVRINQKKALMPYSKIRAEYLAEAGVYKVIQELKNTGDVNILDSTNYNYQIPQYGEIDCSVKNSLNSWEIFSIGKVSKPMKMQKKLKVSLGMAYPEAFKNALFVEQFYTIDSDNTDLSGDAVSKEGLNIRSSAAVDNLPAVDIEFPAINFTAYEDRIRKYRSMLNKEISFDKIYTENHVFNRVSMWDINREPNIYVDGSVLLDGGSGSASYGLKGSGLLVCSGIVTIEGSFASNGELVIIASKGVIIKNKAKLKNVMIYSPELISIEDNVNIGQGLLISENIIRISGNSNVADNSIIFLQGRVVKGELKGKIVVSQQAIVEGTIISHIPRASFVKSEQEVYLHPETVINGIIYSESVLDLRGQVNGSVVSQKLKNSRWIEGKINRNALPKKYVLPKEFYAGKSREFVIKSWE